MIDASNNYSFKVEAEEDWWNVIITCGDYYMIDLTVHPESRSRWLDMTRAIRDGIEYGEREEIRIGSTTTSIYMNSDCDTYTENKIPNYVFLKICDVILASLPQEKD